MHMILSVIWENSDALSRALMRETSAVVMASPLGAKQSSLTPDGSWMASSRSAARHDGTLPSGSSADKQTAGQLRCFGLSSP